jgi:hypothetical protein
LIYSCQNHEYKKEDLCGKNYKVWVSNGASYYSDLGYTAYIIFKSNGSFDRGLFRTYEIQDSIIPKFDICYFTQNTWSIKKDTLFQDTQPYFPIIKKDTLHYGGSVHNRYIDYTDYIEVVEDSLGLNLKLTSKGYDKLYLEKYHLFYDTLSRSYFNYLYFPRKMTPREKKENDRYLLQLKKDALEHDKILKLIKEGKIKVDSNVIMM